MPTKPSSKPRFATDGAAPVIEPSEAQKDVGWSTAPPPHQFFNWLHKFTYEWVNYLEAITDQNESDISSIQSDLVPVGTISPWIGGYFTNGSNGGFTNVLGNTVNNANSYLNPKGRWVANGASPNDPESPIWDSPGKYLPNLTDDRFLMGGTVVGTTGGDNSPSHKHRLFSINTGSNHSALYGVSQTQGFIATSSVYITNGVGHNNSANLDVGFGSVSGSGATHDSNTVTLENRPKYLTVFYTVKVK